jgi:hypothetical protein
MVFLGKVNAECKCKVSAEVNEVEKANSRRGDTVIFTEVLESNASPRCWSHSQGNAYAGA